jgi:DNA-binding CsgD family transcriptional regulator
LQKLIDESFRLDKDWDEFKLYFEQVYVDFYQSLHEKYPDLTNTELRHCALIKLNLSISECANILGISPESVKISRFRLKKKMNLETQNEVRDEIMSI